MLTITTNYYYYYYYYLRLFPIETGTCPLKSRQGSTRSQGHGFSKTASVVRFSAVAAFPPSFPPLLLPSIETTPSIGFSQNLAVKSGMATVRNMIASKEPRQRTKKTA